MNRTAGIFWLTAMLLALVAHPGQAQANGSGASANPGKSTIWDGVYTEQQAERGEQAVQQYCAACHSPAEWNGSHFVSRWSGGSIAHLREFLRSNMPMDGPGKLSPEEYTDIVAYMLRLNRVPTGEKDLPSDGKALEQIEFTRPAPK